jgi:hypothetical protein
MIVRIRHGWTAPEDFETAYGPERPRQALSRFEARARYCEIEHTLR